MDRSIRANPGDLVALMRAGALHPRRVAMAAYLEAEEALLVGVDPWLPPERDFGRKTRELSGTELVVFALTLRCRAWLVSEFVDHCREVLGERSDLASEVTRLARGWCEGAASEVELQAAVDAVEEARLAGSVSFGVARAARFTAGSILDRGKLVSGEQDKGAVASLAALGAARGSLPDDCAREAEDTWRAQALAARLLQPTWPSWLAEGHDLLGG